MVAGGFSPLLHDVHDPQRTPAAQPSSRPSARIPAPERSAVSTSRLAIADLANELTDFQRGSLDGHCAVLISSANMLGSRRDANGSRSPARRSSKRPARQVPADTTRQIPDGRCWRRLVAAVIYVAAR